MTKKRFGIIKTKTYGLYVPVDKMKVYTFSSFESELDCIRVVNALNGLEEKRRENGKIASKYLEENEQLKDKYNEQSVEYEGLEEQIENLLDFRDNVFNLINKKLKEADKGFEQTHDEWYQGQVDALKELKKELITGEPK